MTNTTVDLDAFLAELLGEGKQFTLYGKTWTLAADLPAEVMLAMKSQRDTTDAEELRFFRMMFDPQHQADDLMEIGLGTTAYTTILKIAIAVHGGMSVEDALVAIRADMIGETEKKEPTEPTTTEPTPSD